MGQRRNSHLKRDACNATQRLAHAQDFLYYRVRIANCGGGAVCGHITWLREPGKTPAKIGQRVFYDMKPDGGGWTGSAFNPDDGRTYTGKASVSGSSMTTKGCVLGGLICKSYSWNRVN